MSGGREGWVERVNFPILDETANCFMSTMKHTILGWVGVVGRALKAQLSRKDYGDELRFQTK